MSDASIGTRAYGKRNTRERWYECAIMGEVVPESETVVLRPPRRFAGMRVCFRHLDEMDLEELQRTRPRKTSAEEFTP